MTASIQGRKPVTFYRQLLDRVSTIPGVHKASLVLAPPISGSTWRGPVEIEGTFAEFGMWVHLGGSYWQRASFDAVVVVGALLSLMVVAPSLSGFRPHHWFTALVLALSTILFGVMLVDSFRYADRLLIRVQIIEESQPPLR